VPRKSLFKKLRNEAPETLVVAFVMKEKEIQMALADPITIIPSDGVTSNGKGHPRSAGTFPRALGHYCRNEKIIDRATYENPSLPPDGIAYVIVNGKVVIEKNRMIEMGDLREGIEIEEIDQFICEVKALPKIKIVGLGTNPSSGSPVHFLKQDAFTLVTAVIESKKRNPIWKVSIQ